MKRLTAALVLATILGTLAVPLALALQASGIPSCCRPGGKHHCGQVPTGSRFNEKTKPCPYASHVVAVQVRGAKVNKFEIAELRPSGFVRSDGRDAVHQILKRYLSDRAPPSPTH